MGREQEIHREMLDDISDDYDKQTGSFIYDVTRPAARKVSELEVARENVESKLSIDNLTGDELARRVLDRTGISRRSATRAIGTVIVTGDGVVTLGDRFETQSGIEFEATQTVTIDEIGEVAIRAIPFGNTGAVPSHQITQIPVTIDGILTVTNEAPTFDGFPAESDIDLLQRYKDRIRTPATSGNRYHYLNWAKEVPGVGEARVDPLWNGDNTVKVILIDTDRQPASSELVATVQEYIDPGITGVGDGEAPIGAFVTIVGATALPINITVSLSIAEGFMEEDVLDDVESRLIAYLQSIAFVQDFVSYAQIGSIILNTDGVADYTSLEVNADTSNISVAFDEVAVLGGVSVV